jgi:diacylglycerol kinase family enzyme
MNTGARPTLLHRLEAIGSLVLVAVVVVATLVQLLDEPAFALLQLVLLLVAVCGLWVGLTRAGAARVIGYAVVVASLVATVATLVGDDGLALVSLLIRIVLLAVAVGLAKDALGTTSRSLREATVPGTPVAPAARGVLFMNLKSGGGKPERFDLVAECRRRNIEPVVLQHGEDWLARMREVAATGVDVLGMAGGDGSQALVATVAAEHGLPIVVVPAGTRNHLALDLGLDRDDVVGALDAYGEAVERSLTVAEVNGRAFVNNVSLGLYAAIVRSPEYRDNKVDTTLSVLPDALGPGSEPFDLRYAEPDGREHEGAHLIQISSNPYGTTGAVGSRPRLDTGTLGVITLDLRAQGGAAAFFAAVATGHPERFAGFRSWTAPSFEVRSDGPVDVGLDGEAQELEPPLRFSVLPTHVRVRLPSHAPGYSPAALSLGGRDTVRELSGVVRGIPSRFRSA